MPQIGPQPRQRKARAPAMRIVFMGTPQFAVPTLQALIAAGHEVVAAYTQPPRPGGRRGGQPTPSPVQREAERLGIQVCHPV
ncbi:MAG TPA: methionyl-tRNA formyltransferase, partial [Croceibacterium sp.]|nr:methionyl-tRNA formyltransferase [Croceibacterium sp.]